MMTRVARVVRVNAGNRQPMLNYARSRFTSIADNAETKGKQKGFVSIIDIWDVQYEMEKKFNISDFQSQKLTWDIMHRYTKTGPYA